jgi:hypothetical protein
MEDGGQSSVNGYADFLESECSNSPKETGRQSVPIQRCNDRPWSGML